MFRLLSRNNTPMPITTSAGRMPGMGLLPRQSSCVCMSSAYGAGARESSLNRRTPRLYRQVQYACRFAAKIPRPGTPICRTFRRLHRKQHLVRQKRTFHSEEIEMRRLLILSALALFAVAGTWAGTAAISDSLTVYSPTSVIVGQVGVYDDGSIFGFHAACTGPTCGVTEDSPNIYYIDLSGLTNYTNTTPNTMLLDSPSVGSDVFGQINLDAGFRLFFESNNGTVEFLPNSSYLLVPEGNGYADATAYLTADLRASGYTAQFYSVPDAAAPEPGTLLFLACGLLALACQIGKASWRERG